eukprot:s9820_g2.t1
MYVSRQHDDTEPLEPEVCVQQTGASDNNSSWLKEACEWLLLILASIGSCISSGCEAAMSFCRSQSRLHRQPSSCARQPGTTFLSIFESMLRHLVPHLRMHRRPFRL